MGRINLANKRVYPFFVENPISGDDVPKIRVPRDFVPEQIVAVMGPGGFGAQFDWALHFDPDASEVGTVIHSDTGTNNQTTGDVFDVVTDFASVTVPAYDFIWLELSNVTASIFRPLWCLVEVHGTERGA